MLYKYKVLEAWLKRQFNINVKTVTSDNSLENKAMIPYLIKKGIIWDPILTYTPLLNGITEIKNCYLVKPTITILTAYQLPYYLWGEILLVVNHMYNCLVHQIIHMIPYEVLYGKKPDIYYWQALGYCCWVYIPKEKHATKLDSHAVKGQFVSYANGFYKVYNIKNQKVIQSKDVKF
jgi:hypothetical protein